MWSVWDKKTRINGFSAEDFLNKSGRLANEETIYIKTVNGIVIQAEGKGNLAKVYGIDPTLPDEEFIAVYEAMMAEPDETDTTTYAELAQVYAEGVNSIE